jgi:hypothetical protein
MIAGRPVVEILNVLAVSVAPSTMKVVPANALDKYTRFAILLVGGAVTVVLDSLPHAAITATLATAQNKSQVEADFNGTPEPV